MNPPNDPDTDTETQSDFDTDAAVADISSELFGQGSEEEEGEEDKTGGQEAEDSGDPSADAPESPAQTDKDVEVADEVEGPEENSEEVQALGAPQTWTKEALQEWASIPERAQQEILKREEDMFRGLAQYKGLAEVGQQYSNVVAPYSPILAAEGIDPVQLMQSFAANHYLLTKGTPQQKIELAASMLVGYDIPLAELLNYLADSDEELNLPDPEIQALQQEVGQLRNYITSAQNSNYQQISARLGDEIDAFAKDPAHPYFDELAADIQRLFASGMAESLTEAYEKAVYANPVTRQREIDRLTTERLSVVEAGQKTRQDKIARSTAADVVLTPKNRDGTVPRGTIDDTLEETYAAIASRG